MKPNTSESFAVFFKKSRRGDAYWEEMAILDFTEAVLRRLYEIGVSKTELANRMHVSPAYVTKMIGGRNNFTLRTMVKVTRSLDSELFVKVRPSHFRVRWKDYRTTGPQGTVLALPPVKESQREEKFQPTLIEFAQDETLPVAA